MSVPADAWLTTERIAAAFAITKRAARAGFQRWRDGKAWRGVIARVRVVNGCRGGRAGKRFEALLNTLSNEDQARLRRASENQALACLPPPADCAEPGLPAPLATSVNLPAVVAAAQLPTLLAPQAGELTLTMAPKKDAGFRKRKTEGDWRFTVIEPFLNVPEGPARRMMIRVKTPLTVPGLDGKPRTITARTLTRWIERYLAGRLDRQRRCDLGSKRFYFSRAFDRATRRHAFDEDPEQNEALANQWLAATKRGIEQHFKNLYRSNVNSRSQVRFYAARWLAERCQEIGWPITPEACEDAISLKWVGDWEFRSFGAVAMAQFDIKTAKDVLRPPVARHREGLKPGDIVSIDGWHQNFRVRLSDGKPSFVKAFIFHDLATDVVLPVFIEPARNKGKLTQANFRHALIEALTHERFVGVPVQIQTDHGPEFSNEAIGRGLDELHREKGLLRHRRALLRKPRGKPVEGRIGAIEQQFLSQHPKYAGSNRISDTKAATEGKGPHIVETAIQELQADLDAFFGAYRFKRKAKNSHNGGRSPQEVLNEHYNSRGWRPILLPKEALCFHFAEERELMTDRAHVTCNGQRFYHPDLNGLPHKVRVRYCPNLKRAWWLTDDGRVVDLEPAKTFGFSDPRGIAAANRYTADAKTYVAEKMNNSVLLCMADESRKRARVQGAQPLIEGASVEKVSERFAPAAITNNPTLALPPPTPSQVAHAHNRQRYGHYLRRGQTMR